MQDQNPYQPALTLDAVPHDRSSLAFFWIGLRQGFLWSLLFSVPATFAFIQEFSLADAKRAAAEPEHSPLGRNANSPIIVFCMSAFTALTAISAPWALVAGWVKYHSHRKKLRSLNNGSTNLEDGHGTDG